MDNIYSITILDFNEKIYFLQKRPEFSFESALNLSRNISKSIKSNYLQEFIKKQYEFRLMDTIMTSKIKVKVSLLCEVCVIMLYSSMIDLHLINLYNQRMIEALYSLCKTKKLKMDLLIKRYNEVNRVLEDTIFHLSPKIRLANKAEITFAGTDAQEHSVYFQKYSRAILSLKTQMYHHSTKDFLKAKGEIMYHKNQNDKLNKSKFNVNSFMREAFTFTKNDLLSQFDIERIGEYFQNDNRELDKWNNMDNNIIEVKISNIGNKQETSLDSNKLSTTPSVSPEIITQQVFSVPCQSNSSVFVDNKEEKRQINKSKTEKKTLNIDESIKSLKTIDMNSLLSSINFNFDNQDKAKQKNITNKVMNSANDMFAQDFFNLIPISKPEVVQFNDFKMSNNEDSDKLKPKSSIPPISQEKKQGQPVNYSKEEKRNDFDFLSQFSTKNDTQLQSVQSRSSTETDKMFNFNHIENQLPQAIDFKNLNPISLKEDLFDPNEIKKQIRCSIIEKGTLISSKGAFNDMNYRGQIALELTSNFIIHNKTFFMKVFHPNWADSNCFTKTLSKSIVLEEGQENYKINCREIKSMQRILEYSPNLKIIQPGAAAQVTGAFKGEKYKLELICQMNENTYQQMRASQMIITIITKSPDIVIHKTNNSNYKIEDKKVTYLIKDFHLNLKLFLGIIFKTTDATFVQIVKVNYRYMDILPSSLSAEFSYVDEQNITRVLDVSKKCMVEISFTPNNEVGPKKVKKISECSENKFENKQYNYKYNDKGL